MYFRTNCVLKYNAYIYLQLLGIYYFLYLEKWYYIWGHIVQVMKAHLVIDLMMLEDYIMVEKDYFYNIFSVCNNYPNNGIL